MKLRERFERLARLHCRGYRQMMQDLCRDRGEKAHREKEIATGRIILTEEHTHDKPYRKWDNLLAHIALADFFRRRIIKQDYKAEILGIVVLVAVAMFLGYMFHYANS